MKELIQARCFYLKDLLEKGVVKGELDTLEKRLLESDISGLGIDVDMDYPGIFQIFNPMKSVVCVKGRVFNISSSWGGKGFSGFGLYRTRSNT